MMTATYLRGNGRLLARATVFGMLALAAVFFQAREARAQWVTNGNTTSTTGSVGVGTTDPSQGGNVGAKFTIATTDDNSTAFATGNGTYPRFALNNHSDGSWTMYDYTGNAWNVGITQRGGSIGIGTTAPGARLDVWQANGAAIRAFSGSATAHASIQLGRDAAEASFAVAAAGGQYTTDAVTGDIILRTEGLASRLLFGNGSGQSALAVAGGKVGIGTATPAAKLDVQGGAVNASGGLCIAGDCKTSWSQVGGSQWATSGSSLLYNSGSVGIATQAPATAKLVIGGTAGAEGLDLASADQYANLRVIRNSNSTYDKDLYLQYGAGAGSKIHFYNDNAESMTLVGGRLGVGTNSPTAALDVVGNINVSGNINAKYQDVAEWVPTTQKLSAGTVVVLDTRNSNHVLASHSAYDTRVAGVISAQPGIALGEKGENKALVATTGRVKVKVDATRGAIQIGDLIVTSDAEGLAMKSEPIQLGGRKIHAPGTIIGKALEPLEKGTGEILVLLSLQ